MGLGIVFSLILLLMGITVLVAIHVCIIRRAFRRDHVHGGGGGRTQGQRNMKKVPAFDGNIDDLKNLPCFDYEDKGSYKFVVDCSICLESFKVGDACRLLPNCSHIFHVQCIDSWILKTPFCPICRKWVHNRVMVTTTSAVSSLISNSSNSSSSSKRSIFTSSVAAFSSVAIDKPQSAMARNNEECRD